MTTKVLKKQEIKSWVLNVLSGYCFEQRHPNNPRIIILSPWIKDVQLEISKEFRNLDEEWFTSDYGISSINLPYALLTLKLDFGADIDIVTLPPTRKHHHEQASSVKTLLDFLDEIGCNVYVNDDLHSKLILSNDMALLGSFNLSFAALWGREEVGVSVDDMENLSILERYAIEVVASSKPYGHTVTARQREFYPGLDKHTKEILKIIDRKGRITRNEQEGIDERIPIEHNPINSVTRGWLIEEMVRQSLDKSHMPVSGDMIRVTNFNLMNHPTFRGMAVSYAMVKLAASDIEAFYINFLLTFRKDDPEQTLSSLRRLFDYQGKNEVGEILDFLATKFARPHVPKILPMIMPFPKQE